MLSFRENFLRAARRENPEWVPFDFNVSRVTRKAFEQKYGENLDFAEYFNFDARWIGPSSGTRRPTPDWRALYYADGSLPEEARISPEWGTARVEVDASDDSRMYYPLRDIEDLDDLDAYPWPDDLGAPFRYEGVAEKVRTVQEGGHAVVGCGINYFEQLWGLTGFERLLMGMACEEDWAKALFARYTDAMVKTAENIARTGADVMHTGSDVATQVAPLMSPAMWRAWIFPMMRDVIAAAKAVKPDLLVLYHSDGNVEPLVEGFIEAGVDILDPVQPECLDIADLKARYGDRLSFHGGIGVQSTLPFGTPEEVRETVLRTIDVLGADGGGYLCCPAHKIRPEVPWANVEALLDAVKESGHP